MKPAPRKRPRGDFPQELDFVQHLFARERIGIDEAQPGRTTFLSHVGAQPKLVPGPWIAHRDLVYALALANLTPTQRTSLARAVLVEHDRTFGVGRLELTAIASGLPMGGSSVHVQHRQGGPSCLYTWALGPQPAAASCDWLLLRAQPEWALADAPREISIRGLEILATLGGEVVVLVESAVAAVQIARLCAGTVPVAAHPRFSPYIEGLDPEAPVLLWPHDALDGAGLRRHEVVAVLLVGAPESVQLGAEAWRARQGQRGETIQIEHAACPGRVSRSSLSKFWEACGRPRVLLSGDPGWAGPGAGWLRSLGAEVEVQGEATQLELL